VFCGGGAIELDAAFSVPVICGGGAVDVVDAVTGFLWSKGEAGWLGEDIGNREDAGASSIEVKNQILMFWKQVSSYATKISPFIKGYVCKQLGMEIVACQRI